MSAARYLRWCVSGYGMASARFTALKTQVDRVRNMLTTYEGVVETVKGVQQTLGTEYAGYSMAVRGEVDDELHTAECVLRECDTSSLARRLLAETQAVDFPGAGTGAVQGGETDAKDDKDAMDDGTAAQALDMSQLLRRMQDVRET